MKANVITLITLGGMIFSSIQQIYAQEVSDLDLGLDEVVSESNQGSQSQNNPSLPAQRTTQNLYIVNPNQQTNHQVQKQPTTFIEATPVSESRADQMRKARQETEVNTELKIVEKLEQSRLEDEKKRAQVLFGDKFDAISNQQNQNTQMQQPLQQQPVMAQPVIQPQPIVIQQAPAQEDEIKDSPSLKEEIRAALNEQRIEEKLNEKPQSTQKAYISGMAGVADYPDAVNVKGVMALGLGVGTVHNNRILTEIAFGYANFEKSVDYIMYNSYYRHITDINQYTLLGQTKFQFLQGALRPNVGGALAYNYREFKDKDYYSRKQTATSNSVDFGLSVGVDSEISEGFSIGADYRYMWNISNKTNGYYGWLYPNETPFDELNYNVISVAMKILF